MANRYMLHINKLDSFKEWLKNDGWELEPTKGTYEVLRARKPGRKEPLIIYKKKDAKEHLSLMDRDYDIVQEFIESSKRNDGLSSETDGNKEILESLKADFEDLRENSSFHKKQENICWNSMTDKEKLERVYEFVKTQEDFLCGIMEESEDEIGILTYQQCIFQATAFQRVRCFIESLM